MATREIIKSWFQRGLRPTAAQFGEWIDSFVHSSDMIPMNRVTGLVSALGSIISPGKDEACGAKEIEYRAQAIPVYKDELDLTLDYREQVIEVVNGFQIMNLAMRHEEVRVVIYNKSQVQEDIGKALPQGVVAMKKDLTVDSGDSIVLTFAKCVDGTMEYDPTNIQLRIY